MFRRKTFQITRICFQFFNKFIALSDEDSQDWTGLDFTLKVVEIPFNLVPVCKSSELVNPI